MLLKACTIIFAILLSPVVLASTAPLQMTEGWYEGYDERFLDYKGIQINADGNHRLLTSHLSWGMASARNLYFSDEDIQCSNVQCVIEVPEPDHEDHQNQLVLSPSPTGGWYVMQTSAQQDGELVLTTTYELRDNHQGSAGYEFASRYEEALQNIQHADDNSLDGLWIGIRTGDTSTNLIALEYEQGEAVTLVNFMDGGHSEMVFAAQGVTTSEHSLSFSSARQAIEHRVELDNQLNRRLVGHELRTMPDGNVLRNSLKLIRVQSVR